uniref:Uncharacterized protein n=1 Tax=Amphimedon queenslandica TaxID=400682 RepID=A0A1X7VGE9_AMPQE
MEKLDLSLVYLSTLILLQHQQVSFLNTQKVGGYLLLAPALIEDGDSPSPPAGDGASPETHVGAGACPAPPAVSAGASFLPPGAGTGPTPPLGAGGGLLPPVGAGNRSSTTSK